MVLRSSVGPASYNNLRFPVPYLMVVWVFESGRSLITDKPQEHRRVEGKSGCRLRSASSSRWEGI